MAQQDYGFRQPGVQRGVHTGNAEKAAPTNEVKFNREPAGAKCEIPSLCCEMNRCVLCSAITPLELLAWAPSVCAFCAQRILAVVPGATDPSAKSACALRQLRRGGVTAWNAAPSLPNLGLWRLLWQPSAWRR